MFRPRVLESVLGSGEPAVSRRDGELVRVAEDEVAHRVELGADRRVGLVSSDEILCRETFESRVLLSCNCDGLEQSRGDVGL